MHSGLTSSDNAGDNALDQSFAYDLAGNLTSQTGVGSYTYPAQGPSAVRPHAVSAAGGWTFTYDDNGNQLERLVSGVADRTIAWDGENRPASVTTPGGTTEYRYGPDGSRLLSVLGTDQTLTIGDDLELGPDGIWRKYVHADINVIGGSSGTPGTLSALRA